MKIYEKVMTFWFSQKTLRGVCWIKKLSRILIIKKIKERRTGISCSEIVLSTCSIHCYSKSNIGFFLYLTFKKNHWLIQLQIDESVYLSVKLFVWKKFRPSLCTSSGPDFLICKLEIIIFLAYISELFGR